MTLTFVHLLAMYGVTFAARHASLLDVPRAWAMRSRFIAAMLACPFCTGFHAGWFVYALNVHPRSWALWDALVAGFAGAAFSYGLDVVLVWFESRTKKDEAHVVLPKPKEPT